MFYSGLLVWLVFMLAFFFFKKKKKRNIGMLDDEAFLT